MFHLFGFSHILVLCLVASGLLVTTLVARLGSAKWRLVQEHSLAFLLALTWPLSLMANAYNGTLDRQVAFPFHLCDLTAYLGVWTLWRENRRSAEIFYFWGIGATLQGLLTPELYYEWPNPEFIVFFLLHGGIVLGALYQITGRKFIPSRRGWLRAFKFAFLYLVLAGLFNLAAGTNYGFLCKKPSGASLLDHLGPWPWYLLSLTGLAFVVFWILDLPFRLIHRRRA